MLAMGFLTDPSIGASAPKTVRLTARSLMDEHAKARMLRISEGYEALGRQTEQDQQESRLALTLSWFAAHLRSAQWVGR